MDSFMDSRYGLIAVIVYAALSLIVFVASYYCATDVCAAYLTLPIMPWALIFARDLGLGLPIAVYPIFMLLNVSVLYVLGGAVELGVRKLKQSHEETPLFLKQNEEVHNA